jgi:hypothetical protein
MTKLIDARKIWPGKSDEWLYERLSLELTQKIEEIHRLLNDKEMKCKYYDWRDVREELPARGTYCSTFTDRGDYVNQIYRDHWETEYPVMEGMVIAWQILSPPDFAAPPSGKEEGDEY